MKYCFFPHYSSKNHGCEAIAVSTLNILKKYVPNARTLLLTKYPKGSSLRGEQMTYELYDAEYVMPLPSLKRYSLPWFKYHFGKIVKKDIALDLITKQLLKSQNELFAENDVFVSIGGDNYCYGRPTPFYAMNRVAHQSGSKTILWGCSVEPSAIDTEMLTDLKLYDKIVARESLTYNALVERGLKNAVLYPDPAFTLSPRDSGIKLDNTIGINVSPMIMDYSADVSMVFNAFCKLVRYILEKTDCNIALIPHVTVATTNDAVTLAKLKNAFADESRVFLIGEMDCRRLKDVISQCRFFIGARTHATIAAYSTCVPTLVCGYSVKAKGIATDIFGKYDKFVIPVQNISDDTAIVDAFDYFLKNEDEIRNHLKKTMPDYIGRSWSAGKELCDAVKK